MKFPLIFMKRALVWSRFRKRLYSIEKQKSRGERFCMIDLKFLTKPMSFPHALSGNLNGFPIKTFGNDTARKNKAYQKTRNWLTLYGIILTLAILLIAIVFRLTFTFCDWA